MGRIDDAVQDHLADTGRIVTEWVIFACTQSITDENSAGGYIVGFRPGMLPHHVNGLIEQCAELLELGDMDDD